MGHCTLNLTTISNMLLMEMERIGQWPALCRLVPDPTVCSQTAINRETGHCVGIKRHLNLMFFCLRTQDGREIVATLEDADLTLMADVFQRRFVTPAVYAMRARLMDHIGTEALGAD